MVPWNSDVNHFDMLFHVHVLSFKILFKVLGQITYMQIFKSRNATKWQGKSTLFWW